MPSFDVQFTATDSVNNVCIPASSSYPQCHVVAISCLFKRNATSRQLYWPKGKENDTRA